MLNAIVWIIVLFALKEVYHFIIYLPEVPQLTWEHTIYVLYDWLTGLDKE
jgi:hypothetical protein